MLIFITSDTLCWCTYNKCDLFVWWAPIEYSLTKGTKQWVQSVNGTVVIAASCRWYLATVPTSLLDIFFFFVSHYINTSKWIMCILNRCHRCVYIIFIDTYIHPHVHIHDVYNGAEQQKKKNITSISRAHCGWNPILLFATILFGTHNVRFPKCDRGKCYRDCEFCMFVCSRMCASTDHTH